MHQIKLFSLLAIILCVSCETIPETSKESSNFNDNSFSTILPSIDSLNTKFGYGPTKGMGQEMFKRGADIAGCAAGKALGTTAGVGAGVMTGSPLIAYVAKKGLAYAGGVAGWVLTSAAADWVWNHWISDGCYFESVDDNPVLRDRDSVPFYDITTPGGQHNAVLYELNNNGKCYVDKKGKLDYQSAYNDILQIEEKLGIEDPLKDDDEYRDIILSFCKDVEKATISQINNNETYDEYCSHLLTAVYKYSDLDPEEINMVWEVVDKLNASQVLDDSETVDYESAYIDLIESSDLDDVQKVELVTMGSVAIMSSEYWY